MAQKSASAKSHSALVILEDYVNATMIQTMRLNGAIESSIFGNQTQNRLLQLQGEDIGKKMHDILMEHDLSAEALSWSIELHFLLICIDKVQNLIAYIAKEDGDPKIQQLLDHVNSQFMPFNDARNHLEHIDKVIRKKNHDLGLSAFDGRTFRYFDDAGTQKEIPVDDTAMKLVTSTYESLLVILSSRPDNPFWLSSSKT